MPKGNAHGLLRPRQLHRLLVRCWDVDPHRRPPALEVVRELALLQQQLRAYGTSPGPGSLDAQGSAAQPHSAIDVMEPPAEQLQVAP